MNQKILIVNPYWKTMGGGERYTSSIIEYFLNLNWQVDILAEQKLAMDIWSRFGIDISKANIIPTRNTLDEIWTYKYDLAFFVSDGSLPLSFAKRTLIHFQFPFLIKTGLSDYLKSKFYTFICNSAFTKTFIDKSFHVSSQILYPPIDTDLFKPKQKKNSILYVGRFSNLTQNKNHLMLIKTFKEMKLNNWKLLIAGGLGIGKDKSYISTLRKHSENSNIDLYFNPSTKLLQQLYGQSKLFWSASGYGENEYQSPTKVEHFGMTVVESMAAGCVPLISNLGGHKEIINFKSGFLWDSPSELIRLTELLINNPKLLKFMSQQAQIRSKIFNKACFQNSLKSIIG